MKSSLGEVKLKIEVKMLGFQNTFTQMKSESKKTANVAMNRWIINHKIGYYG